MCSAVRVLTGLAEADLPGAVARAGGLFFHAAIYGNFARNPAMLAALDTALTRPGFRGLDVVTLDAAPDVPWRDEFFAVLRADRFPGDMLAACRESDAFLAALAARYPGRVRRFVGRTLPLVPLILTDDMIFAGQYLHGPVPAPDGLWLAVPAAVPPLVRRAEARIPPGPADRSALAAYRLVRECVAAREAARPL